MVHPVLGPDADMEEPMRGVYEGSVGVRGGTRGVHEGGVEAVQCESDRLQREECS